MWWLLSYLSMTEWLVLVVVFLVAYCFVTRLPWKRLPPGPPNWPVIGSLPHLGGDFTQCLTQFADKYGDIFTIYMGPVRVVVLNGYDVIKQALVTQSGDFEDRSHMYDDFTDHMGVSDTSGEHWRQHRRILLRAMKDFGLSGRRMEVMIQEESQSFISVLQEVGNRPYNIEPIMKKVTSNIISRLFGRHWEYDDPLFEEQLRVTDYVICACASDNPVWTFQMLKYLPGDPFGFHKTLRVWYELRDMYKGWVEEHRQRMADGEEPSDIIGLYLQELEKEKGERNSEFSEKALEHLMSQTFIAGTDTTSSTLVWCFLHLILNPEVQKKMHAEIDEIIGRDRSPKLQDRYDMPYTEAVLSEVQRWSNLIPTAVPHYTHVERELRGFTIPKDTIVIPNLTSILHDPKLWPNPEIFDPERFLEGGQYKTREEMTPFSMGKRACPGEGLAKMELFLFLTHLLQTFTFSIPPGEPRPSTKGVLGFTNQAPPFNMIITVRD